MSWTCAVCTYTNAPTERICLMCSTPKAVEPWTCSVCTFINRCSCNICHTCEMSRYGDDSDNISNYNQEQKIQNEPTQPDLTRSVQQTIPTVQEAKQDRKTRRNTRADEKKMTDDAFTALVTDVFGSYVCHQCMSIIEELQNGIYCIKCSCINPNLPDVLRSLPAVWSCCDEQYSSEMLSCVHCDNYNLNLCSTLFCMLEENRTAKLAEAESEKLYESKKQNETSNIKSEEYEIFMSRITYPSEYKKCFLCVEPDDEEKEEIEEDKNKISVCKFCGCFVCLFCIRMNYIHNFAKKTCCVQCSNDLMKK
jgi:hypothetical protein